MTDKELEERLALLGPLMGEAGSDPYVTPLPGGVSQPSSQKGPRQVLIGQLSDSSQPPPTSAR